MRSRVEVLDFLSDLAGPIGPEVFAGFGSPVQAALAEEPTAVDAIIADWLEGSEAVSLWQELLAIAKADLLEEEYEAVRTRFRDAWDFYLTELIYTLCECEENRLRYTIAELARHTSAQGVAAELEKWHEEGN